MSATQTNNPDEQRVQREPVRRQAVVLIHGIGEQRPMETLRSFVDAFFAFGSYHSKPDTISNSYEMRRIKIRRAPVSQTCPFGTNQDWPESDFYEYYWAHQMYGTRLTHITSWLQRTMFSGARAAFNGTLRDPAYHPRLKGLLLLAWLVAIAVVAGVALLAIYRPGVAAVTGASALGALALWKTFVAPLLRSVLTDVVGDAARYLDVSPQNVARRYDILRGGIDMLRKLHEQHDESDEPEEKDRRILYRYSRIVLVGHSLGSLIAYDILRHYWMEVNGRLRVDPEKLRAVESFDGGEGRGEQHGVASSGDPEKFRRDQQQCWRDLNAWWREKPEVTMMEATKRGHARWLITDLVTLGCPITYGPLLLADSLDDFGKKIRLRELLTCPPNRSQHMNAGRFSVSLSAEADVFDPFPILGHGAPFALTRWTNFYFTNDIVGGSLGNVLLGGIEDVPLAPTGMRLRPDIAHISYWNEIRAAAAPSIARLKGILQDHP